MGIDWEFYTGLEGEDLADVFDYDYSCDNDDRSYHSFSYRSLWDDEDEDEDNDWDDPCEYDGEESDDLEFDEPDNKPVEQNKTEEKPPKDQSDTSDSDDYDDDDPYWKIIGLTAKRVSPPLTKER